MTTKPRIKVPDNNKVGDVIEVKTLISHVMETGNRKGADGNLVPRDLITGFVATFGGKEVFKADLTSGVSANPYISFFYKVTGPGDLELTWTGDKDFKVTEKVAIKVG